VSARRPPPQSADTPRGANVAGTAALQAAPADAPSAKAGAKGPPSHAGHLEGAERLNRVFEALAALQAGRARDDVRIVQYGDSHTASDFGTSVFRRLLQARFGDGGRGFVSIGKPWPTYLQDGIQCGMTTEFAPERFRRRSGELLGDGYYGLLGVGIGASRGGARAWADVSSPFSRVEIDYWQQPRAGSFDVAIDGAPVGRVAARAAQPGSGFASFDVPDGPHQVELRTVGDGEVRVFGMALDRAQAGVVVDALGINGAQVFTPLRLTEAHFAEQLRHRAPDLVILAYGTNEALEKHLDDADYERGLVDLLGRVARAAPNASCLLLGPPDLARPTSDDRQWVTWPRVLDIIAAQRRVARAAGCAFYDQLAAMGGPGTMAAWASEPEARGQRDRMHFTRTGYAQLATWFADDFLRAYERWREDTHAEGR